MPISPRFLPAFVRSVLHRISSVLPVGWTWNKVATPGSRPRVQAAAGATQVSLKSSQWVDSPYLQSCMNDDLEW